MTALGLVLLALVFIEGCRWTATTTTAFVRRPWGGVALFSPYAIREGSFRGVLLPEPWLPALGRWWTTAWPFAIAPRGVTTVGPDAGAPRLVSWETVASARRRGARLHTADDGEPLDAGSPVLAGWLQDLAAQIRGCPEDERATVLRRALRGAFDVATVRARLETLDRARGRADAVSWGLSLNLLGGPVVAAAVGAGWVWPAWLAVHLVLLALALSIYRRVGRNLGEIAPRDRLETALAMVLYPPAALRFQDSLAARVLEGLDPVAATAVVAPGRLPVQARRRLASEVVLHDEWFRGEVTRLVETLLRDGGRAAALTAAPPRESGAQAFCPRCLTQYRTADGDCRDCAGSRRVPFS